MPICASWRCWAGGVLTYPPRCVSSSVFNMEAKAIGRVKFLRERDSLRRPQFHTLWRDLKWGHSLTLAQIQWERHRRGHRDTERMRQSRDTGTKKVTQRDRENEREQRHR